MLTEVTKGTSHTIQYNPDTTYQTWIVGTEGKKANPTALKLGAPKKYSM